MTWFKVDDKLHSHKKATKAGAAAMGLWVLAGSWCADQLTDGFIPDYMAERIDRDYETAAAKLVAAGLWEPAERDGDKGWQFHEWEVHQPTAESVMEKRSEAKARMQRVRAERRANQQAGSQNVRANTSEACDGTSEEVPSTPTRPDPTRPEVPTEPLRGSPPQAVAPTQRHRGTRLPEDWVRTDEGRSAIAWAKENYPNVNLAEEGLKFVNYWISKTGKDATKNDWGRTFQNWIMKANSEGPGRRSLQIRAGNESPHRSPADQRVAENQSLYERYRAREAGAQQ